MIEPARTRYFANHDRRDRFPWSLYHGELRRGIARGLVGLGDAPRVLVVGCGLEPFLPEAPDGTEFLGCDLDAHAIETCRQRYVEMRDRLAVCPAPNELPCGGAFEAPFDAVVAKEVVEHLGEPSPWARALSNRLRVGGRLILTTPNYGFPWTLPALEATVLEWVARRDGYSRQDIHPSKFSKRSLRDLDVGLGMRCEWVRVGPTSWTLIGVWTRVAMT